MSRFHNWLRHGAVFTLTIALTLLSSCAATAQGGDKPKPADYGIKSKKALDLYFDGLEAAHHRDYTKAVEAYNAAISLEPGFGDAYFQAAASAYAGRNLDQASIYAAKAVELLKDPNPLLYLYMAEAAFKKDDFKVAAEHYDKFFSFNPPVNGPSYRMWDHNRKAAHFGAANSNKKIQFEPINMGENVNSIGEEYLPNLTADGQTIFFTSRRPGCTGGFQAEYRDFTEDFYYSEMVDGKWQPCKNLGEPVNTEFNEGAPSFSPDGQYVFFAACSRPGGYGDCDIYVSKLIGTTWSKPQNLGPIVNSPQWDSQPSISNDGKTLYFSSRRPGGKGGEDIWFSNLVNGFWTAPQNIGEPINTAGIEVSPFIHADGKTLYFSSDEHPGYGALDLFMAKNTGNGWTKPENLGYPLNTSASEGNIFVDTKGEIGLINSSRDGGLGKSDIYQFKLDERIRPNFTTYVRGIVTDKATNKVLDAKVTFINVATRDTIRAVGTNAATGRYLLTLPLDQEYAAFVDKKGYLFSSNLFSLKNIDPKTTPYFDVNIALEPLSVGLEVVMSSIFYETNKFDLLDISKPELEHLLSFLQLNKTLRVEIGGHTDNVGTDKENQVLSENRANEVRKYLISKGIKPERIEAKGYGESLPMATGDSDAARALNRRTVCKIIGI
ncbi:MAG: PD40 domain-containing protein [Bacteroidetes bacterium]|nr:PD40 domain-containing protein [Bacteroidota bacterium]